MSLDSRLNRLERAGDAMSADPDDHDWRVEVSRWASNFAGVFGGTPREFPPSPGGTPREFPPSPEGHDSQDWRDAVEAKACTEAWGMRALAIDATLPGMTPGAIDIAARALHERWLWWERTRALAVYANDPRPWFVPAEEPPVPDVSQEAWDAFVLACSVVSFYIPVRDYEEGQADSSNLKWWMAGGVRPPHAHGVEPGFHPNFPERPQWSRLKALPDALPPGEKPPGWFW